MLVDAVIQHWVKMVSVEEVVLDGFGQEIQCLAAFFYYNDRLINSLRPAQIQPALEVLTRLFDRVDLQTNIENMVGMVFQP